MFVFITHSNLPTFWPDSQWPKTVKNIMMSLKSPARRDLQLVRCLSTTITIIFSLSEASDLRVEEMNHGANRWRERCGLERWGGGGGGGDLSCQSRLWQQDLQLLLAVCTCKHVRSSLTIHRIEHNGSGCDINIVGGLFIFFSFWQIYCELNAQTMSKEVF